MDNRPLYALRQAFLSSSAATFWRIPDTHPPILQIPLFAQYLSCFCKPSLLPQSPTIIATPSTPWLYLTLTAHLVPYHQCHSKYTLVISQVHFSSPFLWSSIPVLQSSPSIKSVPTGPQVCSYSAIIQSYFQPPGAHCIRGIREHFA